MSQLTITPLLSPTTCAGASGRDNVKNVPVGEGAIEKRRSRSTLPAWRPYDEAPISRADYIMNHLKLLKKKLELTSPITSPLEVSVKAENVILDLSTAAFELVREALISRFNATPYHSEVKVKTDKAGSIESESVKVYSNSSRAQRNTNSVYKHEHLFTMNLYRTTNKVMVNGNAVECFLAKEIPALVDFIDRKQGEIHCMNGAMAQALKIAISTKENPSSTKAHIPDREQILKEHNHMMETELEDTTKGLHVGETEHEEEKDSNTLNSVGLPVLTVTKYSVNSNSDSEKAVLDPDSSVQDSMDKTEFVFNIEERENTATDITVGVKSDNRPLTVHTQEKEQPASDHIYHKYDEKMVQILNKVAETAEKLENVNENGLMMKKEPSNKDLHKTLELMNNMNEKIESIFKKMESNENRKMAAIHQATDRMNTMNNKFESLYNKIEIKGNGEDISEPLCEQATRKLDQIEKRLSTHETKLDEILNIKESNHANGDTKINEMQQKLVNMMKQLDEKSQTAQDPKMEEIISRVNDMEINKTEIQKHLLAINNKIDLLKSDPHVNSTEATTAKYCTVQGPKDILSNFYKTRVAHTVGGKTIIFPSAEHCIQYRKAAFLLGKQHKGPLWDIMQAKTGGSAKWHGDKLSNHTKIPDWKRLEREVMSQVLEDKATSCPKFCEKLIECAKEGIMLYHTVADRYWGIGVDTCDVRHPLKPIDVQGENVHGELLMNLGRKLLAENGNRPQPTSGSVWNKENPLSTKLSQPEVLLIGNSLLRDIKERALSDKCKVSKVAVPDISSVRDTLLHYEGPEPKCLFIQAITNEVSDTSENPMAIVQQCIEANEGCLDIVNDKWPSCKTIVGLAPPRADSDRNAYTQEAVNSQLRLVLQERGVENLNLDDFGQELYPLTRLYRDNIHFNQAGTSAFAARIKKHIHKVLEI